MSRQNIGAFQFHPREKDNGASRQAGTGRNGERGRITHGCLQGQAPPDFPTPWATTADLTPVVEAAVGTDDGGGDDTSASAQRACAAGEPTPLP